MPSGRRKPDPDRILCARLSGTADLLRGVYVDPKAGRMTFRADAERWRSRQVHRPTTRAYVETMLRRHVYPVLGDRALSSVRPGDVQAFVKGMTDSLASSTVGIVHGVVSGIFRAAVRDRLIVSNPCEGTRLPKVTKARVEPLPIETVRAIELALPARYRALVTLAVGTGMRQGECLGLTVDRVDFLPAPCAWTSSLSPFPAGSRSSPHRRRLRACGPSRYRRSSSTR
jgi:integrase